MPHLLSRLLDLTLPGRDEHEVVVQVRRRVQVQDSPAEVTAASKGDEDGEGEVPVQDLKVPNLLEGHPRQNQKMVLRPRGGNLCNITSIQRSIPTSRRQPVSSSGSSLDSA